MPSLKELLAQARANQSAGATAPDNAAIVKATATATATTTTPPVSNNRSDKVSLHTPAQVQRSDPTPRATQQTTAPTQKSPQVGHNLSDKAPTTIPSVQVPATAQAATAGAAPKPASNPFAKLLASSNAKAATPATAPENAFRGIGLQKREMERAQKRTERQLETANKSIFKQDAIDAAIAQASKARAAEVDEARNAAIPSISIPSVAGIQWDDSQLAAINGLRTQQYGCLIGAAGTGKTTTTKELIRRLETEIGTIDVRRAHPKGIDSAAEPAIYPAIAFCAFTGRATQQLKRALPHEYHRLCATIHATLGYMPVDEEYFNESEGIWKTKRVFRPTFTADNKLPYKVVIVDEAGMVPINLWNALIAALLPETRIILIGDINQLPPVQGRSVLGFAMINWPTFTLETIHRTAADNPVIANAHRVLKGLIPRKDDKHFPIVSVSTSGTEALEKSVNVVKWLHAKGIFDPMRDAFIVPQNKGIIGQIEMNERLVNYFNPPRKVDGVTVNPRVHIVAGFTPFFYAIGDKVMLLQNDRERGLTNGMTGVITNITPNGAFNTSRSGHLLPSHQHTSDNAAFTLDADSFDLAAETGALGGDEDDDGIADAEDEKAAQRAASHIVEVEFVNSADTKQTVEFSTIGQMRQLCHAYAFTCHKSQGGEYDTVVILVHSANSIMLSREWLYTAITRAKKRVILIYNDRGLTQALSRQNIKGDTVREKAEQFIALQDKSDTAVPTLPAAKELVK